MTDPHDLLGSGPLSLRGIEMVLRGVGEGGRLRRRVQHGGVWELIVEIEGRPYIAHQTPHPLVHAEAMRQAREIWSSVRKEGVAMRPAATGEIRLA
jgi:hypothetical protein